MNKKLEERMGSFVRSYFDRFNELCPQLAELRTHASLYAEPISTAKIFVTADGVAVFYLPERAATSRQLRAGISVDLETDRSLSQVVQAVTLNMVKVPLRPIEPLRGDLRNMEVLDRLPPDLPPEEIKTGGLTPEVRETGIKASGINLIGMGATPLWHFEGGVVTATQPSRAHLFSPIVELPEDRLVRQYIWPFMDLLWEPERFDLSIEEASRLVEADIHVLRIGTQAGLPPREFCQNPFEATALQLLLVCKQFEELLNNNETDEKAVQDFLEEPSNRFLVSPVCLEIHPRKRLGGGKYIPDFTVLKPSGDYHFVEIENPQFPIYQASSQEPSRHLTHARTQVEDWLRYVDGNRGTVQQEDHLTGIYKPTGEVVAGRDAHLGPEATRRLAFIQAQSGPVSIKTYDMLLRDARAYADGIRAMKEGRKDMGRLIAFGGFVPPSDRDGP